MIMLTVKWLCILIFLYSVSSSLQDTNEDDRDIQRKRESFGNLLQHLVRNGENDNNGPREKTDVNEHHFERKSYSTGPKRMKITYRRRSRISNKDDTPDLQINNQNPDVFENKKANYNLDNSLTPKDVELLPLLLKYFEKHGDGDHKVDEALTNKNGRIDETRRVEYNTGNANVMSSKITVNRRAWDKMESDLNKDKGNKQDENKVLEKNVYDINQLLNPKVDSELKDEVSHDDLDFERILKTDNQAEIGSVNEVSNSYNQGGGKTITNIQLDSYPVDARNREVEISNTAETKELDESQIDLLVKKMCLDSKSNLLEFWKLAANYFGLNDENLSDTQKFSLFSTILKKIDSNKEQEFVETVHSKPENNVDFPEKNTSRDEKSYKLSWHDHNKPEYTQLPEEDINKEVVMSDIKVGDLGSKEYLVLNNTKSSYQEEPVPIEDSSINNEKDTSSERNLKEENTPSHIIQSGETSSGVLPKLNLPEVFDVDHLPISTSDEKRLTNEGQSLDKVHSAETNPVVLSKELQDLITDSDLKRNLSILSENRDMNPTIKVAALVPDRDKDKKYKFDKDDLPFEIIKGLKEDNVGTKKNNTFVKSQILQPTGIKPLIEEQVLNNDALLEYLNLIINKDRKNRTKPKLGTQTIITKDDEAFRKSSGSKEEILDQSEPYERHPISDEIHQSENLSVENLKESGEKNSKDDKILSLLLKHLESLPEDKLGEIILYLKEHKNFDPNVLLKYNFTLKNKEMQQEGETDSRSQEKLGSDDQIKGKVSTTFIDEENQKMHPKLSFKYNIAVKNNGKPVANHMEDTVDRNQIVATKLNEDGLDETNVRPKLRIKWNLRSRNDLTQVLLQIISRFKEYGITDEALRGIIVYLEQALAENGEKSDCQAKDNIKKLDSLMKAFQNLSALKKQAEARQYVLK